MPNYTNELLQTVNELLKHYWDGRERNVKKQFSAMVAESQALSLLDKINREQSRHEAALRQIAALPEECGDVNGAVAKSLALAALSKEAD